MFKKISSLALSAFLCLSAVPGYSHSLALDRNSLTAIEEKADSSVYGSPVKYAGESEESLFEFKNGSITGYNGTEKNVVIPDRINGETVTSIGKKVFSSNKDLESVTLNSSLEKIEDGAFSNCKNLKTVNFNPSLKSIGKACFAKTAIEKLDFNEGLEKIDAGAFSNIKSLKSVNLPQSLKKIESNAFRGDSSISGRIVFGKNLEYVGRTTFGNADDNTEIVINEGSDLTLSEESLPKNLKKLNIPLDRNVTLFVLSVTDSAEVAISLGNHKADISNTDDLKKFLDEKVKLKTAYDDGNNVFESSIEWNTDDVNPSDRNITVSGKFREFENCSSCSQKSEKYSINIVIENTSESAQSSWTKDDFTYKQVDSTLYESGSYFAITGLSEKGMEKLKSNKNIVIPETGIYEENGVSKNIFVEGIGENAFKDMGIKSVTFPEIPADFKSYTIDKNAFMDNDISELNLPEGIKNIDAYAFKNNRIKKLHIPGSVLKIGNNSFSHNEISALTISDDVNLIQIDNYSFSNNKIKSVNLPYSIFKLKEYVFMNNPGMEKVNDTFGKVYLYTRNPEHLKTGTYIYPSDYQKFILVTDKVDRSELYNNINKSNKLNSSDYIETPWNEFQKELSRVKKVFSDNNATQEDIDNANKDLLNALKQLESSSASKKPLREAIERAEKLNPELYTEKSYKKLARNLKNAKNLLNNTEASEQGINAAINAIDNAIKNLEIKEEYKWNADDFIIDGQTITGYSESGKKKFAINKDLVLPDKTADGRYITSIGKDAFAIDSNSCIFGTDTVVSPTGLDSVILPEKLEEIGDNAFRLNNFRQVKLPETLKYIGAMAFNGNKLEEISIPASVTDMGFGTFSLNELRKIRLPENMKKIPDGIFSRNIKLQHIEIPEGCEEIGRSAFVGAPLKEIKLPDTVKIVRFKAFSGQRAEKIVLPKSMEIIESFGFEENVKFRHTKELVLNEGLKEIQQNAFKSCLLTEVLIPESLEVLHPEAFKNNLNENKEEIQVRLIVTNPEQAKKFTDSEYKKIIFEEKKTDDSDKDSDKDKDKDKNNDKDKDNGKGSSHSRGFSGSGKNNSKAEKYNRIAGDDRIGTAIAISRNSFKNSENVILVSASKYNDALCASALSGQLNAPVLLTDSDRIEKRTFGEIKRLNAKNIYIIGGVHSVGNEISQYIKNENLNVIRLDGKDRFETAVKVADRLTDKKDSVYIVNSEKIADGVIASNPSAKNKIPVLYIERDRIPEATMKYLKDKNVFAIGGTDSIPESTIKDIGRLKRISGKDRYSTSLSVVKETFTSADRCAVASGSRLIDALTASSLVHSENMPVVLIKNGENPEFKEWKNNKDIGDIAVIGGENSVTENTVKMLKN